jgi:hypothetical protein
MASLQCPNCGHELERTTRFCAECGARLQADDGILVARSGPSPWDDVRRSLRDVLDYTRVALGATSGAQLELLRGRRRLSALAAQRAHALYELGDATHREDSGAAEAARAAVRQLDEALAATQAGMEETVREARERIAQARLQTQPTERVAVDDAPTRSR